MYISINDDEETSDDVGDCEENKDGEDAGDDVEVSEEEDDGVDVGDLWNQQKDEIEKPELDDFDKLISLESSDGEGVKMGKRNENIQSLQKTKIWRIHSLS